MDVKLGACNRVRHLFQLSFFFTWCGCEVKDSTELNDANAQIMTIYVMVMSTLLQSHCYTSLPMFNACIIQ